MIINRISVMESSVAKWERIIAGKSSDGGVIDCPPCRIYYMLVCIGCPIAEYTGKKFCQGSPYGRWLRHQIDVHDKLLKKAYCEECVAIAGEMRDFMKDIVAFLKEKEARKQREKTGVTDPGASDGTGATDPGASDRTGATDPGASEGTDE